MKIACFPSLVFINKQAVDSRKFISASHVVSEIVARGDSAIETRKLCNNKIKFAM